MSLFNDPKGLKEIIKHARAYQGSKDHIEDLKTLVLVIDYLSKINFGFCSKGKMYSKKAYEEGRVL